MQLMQIMLVGVVVLGALFLGGMAAAWRRACVTIAQAILLPGQSLSQDAIIRVTPAFVSLRHLMALGLLGTAALLALFFFGWQVGLGVLVGCWIGMEAAGSIFPRPTDLYYVRQIYEDLQSRAEAFRKAGDEPMAREVAFRLELLEAVFLSAKRDTE